MSRIKTLQAASAAMVTSEGLWFLFSATPFLSLPSKYSADHSLLPIFCFTFLPPCFRYTERCLGHRREASLEDPEVVLSRAFSL